MGHIAPLPKRLIYFCASKIVRAGDEGQLQGNNIFKTQQGGFTYEFISVVTARTVLHKLKRDKIPAWSGGRRWA